MKRNSVNCLRCNVPMRFLGEEKIQLGQSGWVLGDLPNLFAGALNTAIFSCPRCGKLEFFHAEGGYNPTAEGPRTTCPECMAEHDAYCGCCPICGHVYTK